MRTVPIPAPELIEKARYNLLHSKYVRPLFPEGKAGEEEMLRVFRQMTEATLPLHDW